MTFSFSLLLQFCLKKTATLYKVVQTGNCDSHRLVLSIRREQGGPVYKEGNNVFLKHIQK